MTDLKELKKIADTALDDILVSEELKEKTLKGLHKKKISIGKLTIAPAACMGVIMIVLLFTRGLSYSNMNQASESSGGSSGINTMAADTNTSKTNPESVESKVTFDSNVQVLETWNVKTMDEAKEYLDGTVLTPSYLPDGFKLKEIMAAGPKKNNAISVVMEFESKGHSFFIQQDKVKAKDLKGSKEVDINGVKGYIDSFKSDDKNNPIYSTSLKWYIKDMLYMVQGAIPEEEAIKVAKGLK